MTEESLQVFLTRRQRELTAQIAALAGQLAHRETELAQVQQFLQRVVASGKTLATVADYSQRGDGHYEKWTIKQLVLQALHDRYPEGGASAGEIRDFIQNGFGRVIGVDSLRPQLHRLKANRQLSYDAKTRRWITPKPPEA